MTGPSSASALDLDDTTDNLLSWVKANGRQLGFGALGIAAVAGILWVVRAQNERSEMTASQQLVAAQRTVGSGNLPVAAADLKKLAQQYGSTRAGTDAKVLLGQVLLQQGKPDEALKELEGIGSSGPTAASVHALRGAALEQSGKYPEAAAAYLKAAESTVLKAEGESFKSDAARAWLAAGKRDEALKIWQSIATNPGSVLYNEALLRVGELTAK
ncbi:MAG: tetratricopeptide repeat protein [Gemmatimonadetes bacterium]|nr:tetratricopeptide repeat protein [Gemmatimonadota bacterium]